MRKLALFIVFILATQAWAREEGRWWYHQAKILYQEGDRERALALLEELNRRFPEDKEILVRAKILMARIYFEEKDYDQVLRTLRPLIQEVKLPPEALLLLAQAAEKQHIYDEALTYLRLLKRDYPEAKEICAGNLVAARIFAKRKLKEKAQRLARRTLERASCPLRDKAQAVSILLELGESPEKVLSFINQNPQAKRYAPAILKSLALYHLRKGKLQQAEAEIFEYLNYSGKIEEAPALLYSLGEAYLKQKNFRAAKRIFELVLTSWPHRKEALFAKFRLYQMRYLFEEKIGHKTPKTRRILLSICRRLIKEYPDASLTEEAFAFKVKLLFEDKRILETLESIWTFLEKYPGSPYRREVLSILCRASSLFEQGLLAKKEFQKTLVFFRKHQESLKEGGCGASFYFAAEAALALGLKEEARLILLEGSPLPVPKAWAPNYRLTLVDLLYSSPEKEDRALARQLLEDTLRRYPVVSQTPYYHFLWGRMFAETAPLRALEELKRAVKEASDPELKARAENTYWSLLLRVGRYEEAFLLLQKKKKGDPTLYKLLASRLLQEGDLKLAEKVIAALEAKYPKDPETYWLKGLLLEKQGEAQKALSVWQKVAQKGGLYGQMAQAIIKASQLVEASKSELY